jgi:IS5 family transposase
MRAVLARYGPARRAMAGICASIEPCHPEHDGTGRPTVGLERMVRIYRLQHGFNPSDPGVEEALYDSRALCALVGIDLGRKCTPEETAVCEFRHRLRRHGLDRATLRPSPRPSCGLGVDGNCGAMVDGAIIEVPLRRRTGPGTATPRRRARSRVRSGVSAARRTWGLKANRDSSTWWWRPRPPCTTCKSSPSSCPGPRIQVWGDAVYAG